MREPGDGSDTGIGTDANDLIGVVWVLDDASIAGLVDEASPGAQVTLTFEEGQAHGTAACNSYSGAYRADDDGSMSFDGFAVTEMGCDPPIMALESAYLSALDQVTTFGIEGNLSLTGGDVVLGFNEEAPVEPLPLVGTMWTLTSVASGDAVTSVVSGTITVGFAADETFSRSAGCNRFDGTYSVTGDRLSFSPLATTKMACADHVMAQERVFLDTMSEVASYDIEGPQLTVLDGSGAMLLGFDGASS